MDEGWGGTREGLDGGPSDAPVPTDVPMEEAADYSEADKSSLSDELEDSGVIPGSHSENALHASEEEEGEGRKAQRYIQGPFRRLQAWASLSLRWANISV